MKKFIPYEKLSKKKKREIDRARRTTWGELNPVTRKSPNPRAYDRQKARRWKFQDHPDVPSFLCLRCPDARPSYREFQPERRGIRVTFPERIMDSKGAVSR